jgi:hypothetical protein
MVSSSGGTHVGAFASNDMPDHADPVQMIALFEHSAHETPCP